MEVVQFLDAMYPDGIRTGDHNGYLPLHHAVNAQEASMELIQYLIDRCPEGIRVADRDESLPLHVACSPRNEDGRTRRPTLNIIRLLLEADLFTIVQNSQHGTPYQMVYNWLGFRHTGIEAFLLAKQNEALTLLREACDSLAQLGLPDLVVAEIWAFAKPDLWAPGGA